MTVVSSSTCDWILLRIGTQYSEQNLALTDYHTNATLLCLCHSFNPITFQVS